MTKFDDVKSYFKSELVNAASSNGFTNPLFFEWLEYLLEGKNFKDKQLIICLAIDIRYNAIEPFALVDLFRDLTLSKLEDYFSDLLLKKPHEFFGRLLEQNLDVILQNHNNKVEDIVEHDYFQVMKLERYKTICLYFVPVNQNITTQFQQNALEFLKPKKNNRTIPNDYLKSYIGKEFKILNNKPIYNSNNINWVTDANQMIKYLNSDMCEDLDTMANKLFNYFALPVSYNPLIPPATDGIPYVGLRFKYTEKLKFCQPCTFHTSWVYPMPVYFISYPKNKELWGRSFNYIKYPLFKNDILRDARERTFQKYLQELSEEESPIISIHDVGNLTHTTYMQEEYYIEEGINRLNK